MELLAPLLLVLVLIVFVTGIFESGSILLSELEQSVLAFILVLKLEDNDDDDRVDVVLLVV
jgi:hypothetical protein